MGYGEIDSKRRAMVPGDLSEHFSCLMVLNQVRAIDQVWTTDISSIPLQNGCINLLAIVELFSRHLLCLMLSNNFGTAFSQKALFMALARGFKPSTFHSDQVGQFTSSALLQRLNSEQIKIGWAGR